MLWENKPLLPFLYLSEEWFLKFKYPWVLFSSKVIRISTYVLFIHGLIGDGSHSVLLCSLVHVLGGLLPPLVHPIMAFWWEFFLELFWKAPLAFYASLLSQYDIASCEFYFAEQERWKRNWWFFWRFFLMFQHNFWVFILSMIGNVEQGKIRYRAFCRFVNDYGCSSNINPVNCIIFKPTFL